MGLIKNMKIIISLIIYILCSLIDGILLRLVYYLGIWEPIKICYDYSMPEIPLYIFICISVMYTYFTVFLNTSIEGNKRLDAFDPELYSNILSRFITRIFYIMVLLLFYLCFKFIF